MTIDVLRNLVTSRAGLPAPERCRELREWARLTLGEIGDSCDADEASVSRWERGVAVPRGAHLERYVAVLRMLEEEYERKGAGAEAA